MEYRTIKIKNYRNIGALRESFRNDSVRTFKSSQTSE